MSDTEYTPSVRFTPKERKLKNKCAKLLRDMMLQTLEEWNVIVQKELSSEQVNAQCIEKIKNKILNEVNRHLVWKVLAKKDRYDTPYYRAQLEELKNAHPNLEIVNNLHCFVSWPVFNQADIDRALSMRSDVPALLWEDEDNL